MPDAPLLPFPREDQLARAYFQEAARHLQDARTLHLSRSFAGAITSAMKAVELGLKSAIILYGGQSWLEWTVHNLYTTLENQKNIRVTKSLIDALANYDPELPADIKAVERLVPEKPNLETLGYDKAVNTEYPFFGFPPKKPQTLPQLFRPHLHFSSAESRKHYDTAHRLLTALKVLSPEIRLWNISLPRHPTVNFIAARRRRRRP